MSSKARSLEELRRERLEAHLEALASDVERHELDLTAPAPGLVKRVRKALDKKRPAEDAGAEAAPEPAWLKLAKKGLDEARSAMNADREQVAWTHCHQASRFLLEGAYPDQVRHRGAALRKEAGEKLSNWRKEAVLDLLEPDGKSRPGRSEVILAQFLLDQHFHNVYFKLEVLKTRIKQLWVVLAALTPLLLLAYAWLVGLVGLVGEAARPSLDAFWRNLLEGLGIMLLGAAGAALSHTLTAIRSQGRIPQILKGYQESLLRLLIGAQSAIVVVLVLRSKLLPIEEPTEWAIYAWAAAAGLSDQLLTRMIRRLEESVRK